MLNTSARADEGTCMEPVTGRRSGVFGPPRHGRPVALSEELVLPAAATSVSCARRFIEAQLRKWQRDEATDTVDLVASELLTNAVKATGVVEIRHGFPPPRSAAVPSVAVRLWLSRSSVFIDVWDIDPAPPVPVLGGELDEGGRGLILVTALTRGWGHYASHAAGKVVWAEVAVRPEAAGRAPS
jgi:hypothetical protein